MGELKSQLSFAYLGIQNMTIKEANEDYRKKLWKYIQDISNFVDNTNKVNKSKQKYQNKEEFENSMKIETDKMFEEIKTAFRKREEQLTKAAHNFKKQSKRIAIKQELLLIHYRNQRDQLILASEMQQNLPIFQIGPEPSKLILDENDLASQNKVELDKLRVQVDKYRDELQYKNVELEKIN